MPFVASKWLLKEFTYEERPCSDRTKLQPAVNAGKRDQNMIRKDHGICTAVKKKRK